jgi:6-phosphogluconolactonase (cycloisomerase 2 family)
MSPDGRNLYGTSAKTQRLYVYSVDREKGYLTKEQELDNRQSGVRAVQVISSLEPSPDGSVVIATCPADQGEVSVLHRDSDSGKLSVAQVLTKEKTKIEDLVGPRCSTFSRDGATLYVGCTTTDSVVVLRKDPKTNMFSYLETIKDPSVKDPTCLAVNDRYLFVCSREPGTLTVFRINEDKDKPKTKVQEEPTMQ